ncbi:hypothetical protein [Mucilaginibacter psychrotolerans]|uniref:Uncharacterized protein n=1 Tax=Mucilaginibacter psychrotolerans TaxID=1524096 RepID=A0A4Y8S4Q1_9SPHI|nr:hypothetical protein [Mucilaginibacter psychrotolerans]TFF33615.1 hypothetical protein E2R66_24910 [Mucilaginibacter psychrotolerans]
MEEANIKPHREPKWVVVAINIAIMVAYTLYFRFGDQGQENIIAIAMLIVAQVVLCLILAIFVFSKEFLLSAAMVLVIGFSTCWLVFAV